MRALWPLRRRGPGAEAAAAVEAADESLKQAVAARRRATAQRVEADRLAAQIRGHNVANRYDDWLRKIVQEGST